MWSAAIARWCISSHPSDPPHTWGLRTAPHRCSRGRCGDPCPAGLTRLCCSSLRRPSCRSGGYWRRCPSHQWSSRRRLRFPAWSPTQIWGPWRISPNPRRSAPEKNGGRIVEKIKKTLKVRLIDLVFHWPPPPSCWRCPSSAGSVKGHQLAAAGAKGNSRG